MTTAGSPPPNDVKTATLTRVLLSLGIVVLSLALLELPLAYILRSLPSLALIVIFAVLLVYLIAPVVGLLKRVMPNILRCWLPSWASSWPSWRSERSRCRRWSTRGSSSSRRFRARRSARRRPERPQQSDLPESSAAVPRRDYLGAATIFRHHAKYALVIGQQGIAAIFSAFGSS